MFLSPDVSSFQDHFSSELVEEWLCDDCLSLFAYNRVWILTPSNDDLYHHGTRFFGQRHATYRLVYNHIFPHPSLSVSLPFPPTNLSPLHLSPFLFIFLYIAHLSHSTPPSFSQPLCSLSFFLSVNVPCQC